MEEGFVDAGSVEEFKKICKILKTKKRSFFWRKKFVLKYYA